MMEVDEAGIKYPKKCQLTLVFDNGTTIQTMVNDYAEATRIRIANGIANNVEVAIDCVAKDERIETDMMYIQPGKLMFYSIMQPKAESRIHTAGRPIIQV